MKKDRTAAERAADMLIEKLREAGYEAWYVGGYVRDFVMQKIRLNRDEVRSGDIDLTTNATPDQMKEALNEFHIIETGIKHGTVTVLMPQSEAKAPIPIEITTYRSDGDYSDSRHPDSVRFVRNLEEDLARRDFTVNAMAMDDKGNIVDPFGGRQDLRNGIIRAVGDPDKRFQEDALRIMRALRFAAVLEAPGAVLDAPGAAFEAPEAALENPGAALEALEGATLEHKEAGEMMKIETRTEEAIFRNKELLKNISAERILVEFRKLVTGKNAGIVIRRYVDVLGVIMPELLSMKGFEQHNPYHKYDVLEHCIRAMEAVSLTKPNDTADMPETTANMPDNSAGAQAKATDAPAAPRDYMKIAALFHDVGKPETFFLDEEGIGHMYGHPAVGEAKARRMLNRLKADNALTSKVCKLIKYHDLVFQNDERLLKRWLNRYGPELLLEILEIKKADNIATGNMSHELGEKFDEVRRTIKKILAEEDACFSLKDLAINGRDLIDSGIAEGKAIGEVLDAALEAVIDGEVPNEKSELLKFAQNRFDM